MTAPEPTDVEAGILALKEIRDQHEATAQQLIDDLDEAVRHYLDEFPEGKGPTHLAQVLGLTRGRVYQLRDRGREKHAARVKAEKAAARRAARSVKKAPAKKQKKPRARRSA
ncbi:MAG: hypothetical protein WD186_07140 [Actinomycetota bacterium]